MSKIITNKKIAEILHTINKKQWKYHSIGNKFPFVIGSFKKTKSDNIEVKKEFMRIDYYRCSLLIEYFNNKDGNYNYEIRMHTMRMNEMIEDKPEWLI
jgi:hypothetical protein